MDCPWKSYALSAEKSWFQEEKEFPTPSHFTHTSFHNCPTTALYVLPPLVIPSSISSIFAVNSTENNWGYLLHQKLQHCYVTRSDDQSAAYIFCIFTLDERFDDERICRGSSDPVFLQSSNQSRLSSKMNLGVHSYFVRSRLDQLSAKYILNLVQSHYLWDPTTILQKIGYIS